MPDKRGAVFPFYLVSARFVKSFVRYYELVLWVILRILQKELPGPMNAGFDGRGAAICYVRNLFDGIPLHTQNQGGAVNGWHRGFSTLFPTAFWLIRHPQHLHVGMLVPHPPRHKITHFGDPTCA